MNVLSAGLLALLLAGCATRPVGQRAPVPVPKVSQAVLVDGVLDEPCYTNRPLVRRFVRASAVNDPVQSTRVWAFWNAKHLVFAFEVTDTNIVALPGSRAERDVDGQDRVEVFLWSGGARDRYYCLEIAARGAVHDYAAEFYRRFDDSWSPSNWRAAVAPSAIGYGVEIELTREAVAKLGLHLKRGERFRVGLFRADFHPGASDPDWLCWVDAGTPRPDFHVPAAFAEVILAKGAR